MENSIKDEHKIAFIVCVNDDMYFEECQYYINTLDVPEGYMVEIIAERNAASMCSAYNHAMNNSDARYKIYLHQDVYIRNRSFLHEILNRFIEAPEIGMIGMIGARELPADGIVFTSWDVGMVDVREPDMAYYYVAGREQTEDTLVTAVDGLLIATQYDVQWREDLFQKFDFYDASQGCEFIKSGYKVLVPYQGDIPWVIHDCGFAKLKNYICESEIFAQHYGEFLTGNRNTQLKNNDEWDELSNQLAQNVEILIQHKEWNQVRNIMSLYHSNNYRNSELERQYIFLQMYDKDIEKNTIFSKAVSCLEFQEAVFHLRSLFRLIELRYIGIQELVEKLNRKEINIEQILYLIVVANVDKKAVVQGIIDKISKNEKDLDKLMCFLEANKFTKLPIAYGKNRE